MDPIADFLCHDKLQEDKRKMYKLRVKATHFLISPTRDLYKKYYSGPYLLFIHLSLIEDILFKIHEAVYKLH